MKTVLLACVFLAAAPALAQQPQTGTAAPAASPPSGVSTPAPVPTIPPPAAAPGSAPAVPEQIAPPAGTAGPSNATPFSNVPTGAGGNSASPLPNVSK